jgi:hypothetical protein
MVKLPTEKQRRIVKAKIAGKKNRDIAKVEYPNATQESQDVIISRELTKPEVAKYYEESKLIALKNAGIDWQWIVDRVSAAGNAIKQSNTGEVTPDHSVRLSAVKHARDMLEAKNITEETKELIRDLPSNIDEIQLVRILNK